MSQVIRESQTITQLSSRLLQRRSLQFGFNYKMALAAATEKLMKNVFQLISCFVGCLQPKAAQQKVKNAQRKLLRDSDKSK